ncbi:hypothetical protein HOY80DRAFT_997020 [Tuber brumale]|nr:hypothetical protein HOY80DRAFT_997020 [Tuber brumale]
MVLLASFGHTRSLYVGRMASSSQIRLPLSVRGWTESVIADFAASHPANSAHSTLGGPHLQLSPIYARKRSKHQLTIPLNQIHSRMLGMDPDLPLTPVVRGCKDELSERIGKPPPGPDEKSLTAVRERSGLWAVVVAGPIALGKKVSMLWDDTLFFPRLPDIYFENLHHTPGAQTEKNKAQRGKLDNLIIATNRLLPIVTPFFRQIIDQLWTHLNPNAGVLPMIERGTPMRFEAIAYARSTMLKDFIENVGEAFQSLPATNAHGSANLPIEKGPGATIAPRTNHECPMFVTGPTDGTQCKDWCRSSQNYTSPGYLQRHMDESSKNHEGL